MRFGAYRPLATDLNAVLRTSDFATGGASLGNHSLLSAPTGVVTVFARICIPRADEQGFIFSKSAADAGTNSSGYSLYLDLPSRLLTVRGLNGVYFQTTTMATGIYPSDVCQWINVALVLNSNGGAAGQGVIQIFLNNKWVYNNTTATFTIPDTSPTGAVPYNFIIGNRADATSGGGNQAFQLVANYSKFRVWNSQLTLDQLQMEAAGRNSGATNLVVDLRLDEGVGTTVVNYASDGTSATAGNGTLFANASWLTKATTSSTTTSPGAALPVKKRKILVSPF